MPGLVNLPPFPKDVPTVPLLVIDYDLIKQHDESEIGRLWKAATEFGFWYLKNHGVEDEVDGMFDMGEETMKLPLDEKMKFEQGDEGRSFGYKSAGANATDEYGNLDTPEFMNVAKDDALAYPTVVHREYPCTVNARMEGTIRPFIQKSLDVNLTLLAVFNERLGLPEGTLAKCHLMDEHSACESRVIKNPPKPGETPEDKAAIGAHTDFGSLSFLHNRLGGLQVMVPGTELWRYVIPIPKHAICNIGDALAVFSGGILRSNLHRVVPPPKEQGKYERWSLVFFLRPGNSIPLRPFTSESQQISDAVAKLPAGKYDTGVTAKEWFSRRIKNQRINNRKGPETWRESRGTEHKPQAY